MNKNGEEIKPEQLQEFIDKVEIKYMWQLSNANAEALKDLFFELNDYDLKTINTIAAKTFVTIYADILGFFFCLDKEGSNDELWELIKKRISIFTGKYAAKPKDNNHPG